MITKSISWHNDIIPVPYCVERDGTVLLCILVSVFHTGTGMSENPVPQPKRDVKNSYRRCLPFGFKQPYLYFSSYSGQFFTVFLFLTAAGCTRKGFYTPPKIGAEKSYQSADY